MAKPPQDPGSGPRIRARARGGSSSIRPEVVDALGEVERSLTEVAKWEQMLAGRSEGGPVIPSLPEGYVALAGDTSSTPVEAEPAAEEEPVDDDAVEIPVVREIGLLDAVRAADEAEDADEDDDEDDDEEPQDAAAAADALVAPLLTEFHGEGDDEPAPEDDGSVLWAARTVEDPSPEAAEELIARRRRNARILSWAGALVLVAGAALWLVPDRSSDDDDQLPPVDVTATTQSDRQLLTDTTEVTVSTTTTTATTTPSTTETTRRTTATTARSTATTAPPATVAPTSTLGLPGNPGTVNPSRTVPTAPTTAPPTTTTAPPATTTTLLGI